MRRAVPSVCWAPRECGAKQFEYMYYVYILLSLKDKNFYVGYTANLKERYKQHCLGKVESTKNRRPLKLMCYEAYNIKAEATGREKFLKSSDGKKDLRKRLLESLNNIWRGDRVVECAALETR